MFDDQRDVAVDGNLAVAVEAEQVRRVRDRRCRFRLIDRRHVGADEGGVGAAIDLDAAWTGVADGADA